MSSVAVEVTNENPEIHIEENIVFPTWQTIQAFAHINGETPSVDKLVTGCGMIVGRNEISFNPRKVTCKKCRKFAKAQHEVLVGLNQAMAETVETQMPKRFRKIAKQYVTLASYHEGVALLFGKSVDEL